MSDLDAELRRGLGAVAPSSPGSAQGLLPEFRRRLVRRRQRRMASVGVVLVAVLAGAVAVAMRPSPEAARPVATTSTSTSTTVVARPAVEAGPALTPGAVQVPPEGVAVEVASVGVVLVGFDGRVHGHLPGFTLEDDGLPSGPQLLFDGARRWLLADGRLAEVDGYVVPLAYGAELAHVGERDPGRWVVRRDGRELFEVGEMRSVSHDRDIVTSGRDVHDLRSGRRWQVPDSCAVADRHGRRHYVMCEVPTALLVADGERVSDTALLDPLQHFGRWRRAMVSPDGSRLLLQWAGECEVETVAMVRSGGGSPTEPFGPAMAEAHGWASDGRAVVSVGTHPGCGEPAEGAEGAEGGVYLLSPDGRTKARIYATAGDRMAMWSPALR